MCDDFPIDDGFGVMCEVLEGGEKGQMPLSELKVEPDNPNYQIVDDYVTWFVNAPQAGMDDDLGGDLDDEDEDWAAEEDDFDDSEMEDVVPPPARQRTGRNKAPVSHEYPGVGDRELGVGDAKLLEGQGDGVMGLRLGGIVHSSNLRHVLPLLDALAGGECSVGNGPCEQNGPSQEECFPAKGERLA